MVQCEGLMSEQGIRRGRLSSADLFNYHCIPLLNRVADHPDSYVIGHINVSSVMVADDLVLATSSTHGMQNLLNEAEADTRSQRYIFSEIKAKFQIINEKFQLHPKPTQLRLNSKTLTSSTEKLTLVSNNVLASVTPQQSLVE